MNAALALLAASFLGSAHCAAMCGGFVALYSADAKTRWQNHAAYNFGRLCTYSVLGIFAGFVGNAFDSAGAVIGVQRVSLYLVGAGLIVFGLSGIIRWNAPERLLRKLQQKISAIVIKLSPRTIGAERGTIRALLIGISTTFLPCGWLYSFVAVAAAAETLAQSLIVMMLFWLGTLPVMLSLGIFARRLLSSGAAFFPRLSAALVLCAGIFCLLEHSTIHKTLHTYTCHQAGEPQVDH